ncbi:MAG: hypothetical protein GY950_30610, partial [bacterium]|nr:hypothetical protein [bacterium]
MQVEVRREVADVFQSFGMGDVGTIIENEAIMILLSKESRYQAEYNTFKAKYNSEFRDFKKKVAASDKEDF